MPCVDSAEAAATVRRALDIPRDAAQALGLSAVRASAEGRYRDSRGKIIDFKAAVNRALASKISLPPGAPLPEPVRARMPEMRVSVVNETTMTASRRLVDAGHRTLALNFANGVVPGGGFLHGARGRPSSRPTSYERAFTGRLPLARPTASTRSCLARGDAGHSGTILHARPVISAMPSPGASWGLSAR